MGTILCTCKRDHSEEYTRTKQDLQKVTKGEIYYYFAIGSMMNPTSLKLREIDVIRSYPGVIQNFKLNFAGRYGMAEALPSVGNCFHGVVHEITKEMMVKLDEIEFVYDRCSAQCKLYDGTEITVTVYIFNRGREEDGKFLEENNPPQRRYLEIMMQGAKYFGVRQEYINSLNNHECVKRPSPPFNKWADRSKLPVVDPNKLIDTDEICYRTLNGTVWECERDKLLTFWKKFEDAPDNSMELQLSRILYDPKYGTPETRDDLTAEHSAYIEHFIKDLADMQHPAGMTCIGKFDQKFSDEGPTSKAPWEE